VLGAAALAALAVIGIVLALVLTSGGDDDGGGSQVSDEAARGLVPALSDLGYETFETGRDPLVPANVGMARALYQLGSDVSRKVSILVFLLPDEPMAAAQFDALGGGYATAPIGTLLDNPLTAGPPGDQPPANRDAAGPVLGQSARSFATIQADSLNNGVTTDIYRQGQLVWVVQLLHSAGEDHLDLRTEIASRVLERYQGGTGS
jgi:hypothetical protein